MPLTDDKLMKFERDSSNVDQFVTTNEIVSQEITDGNYHGDLFLGEDIGENPTKADKIDDEFKCEQCEYRAKQSSHIKAHIKAKHEGIKFPCDLCDYKASFSHHLKSHKRRMHSIKC
eukprot:GFUD01038549.1.p1 GENE.GFUD01038549.1~~GFUD01038549.1.p1  ORF type:complete len:117 (+),score=26.48 GFUD01038549.1:2-352(+)